MESFKKTRQFLDAMGVAYGLAQEAHDEMVADLKIRTEHEGETQTCECVSKLMDDTIDLLEAFRITASLYGQPIGAQLHHMETHDRRQTAEKALQMMLVNAGTIPPVPQDTEEDAQNPPKDLDIN